MRKYIIPLYTCPKCNKLVLHGIKGYCKSCYNTAAQKVWRNAHRQRCNQTNKESNFRQRKRLKDVIQAAYGNKCVCCGETEPMFLTIDHINNDGAAHRRKIGLLYPWLRKHNFPPEFQLLCFNCNHGKHLNGGICPHKGKSVSSENEFDFHYQVVLEQ